MRSSGHVARELSQGPKERSRKTDGRGPKAGEIIQRVVAMSELRKLIYGTPTHKSGIAVRMGVEQGFFT